MGWAKGVVLTTSGLAKEDKAHVRRTIKEAGGDYSPNLSKRCTHIVARPGTQSEKLNAVRNNPQHFPQAVVRAEWLDQCAASATRLPLEQFALQAGSQSDAPAPEAPTAARKPLQTSNASQQPAIRLGIFSRANSAATTGGARPAAPPQHPKRDADAATASHGCAGGPPQPTGLAASTPWVLHHGDLHRDDEYLRTSAKQVAPWGRAAEAGAAPDAHPAPPPTAAPPATTAQKPAPWRVHFSQVEEDPLAYQVPPLPQAVADVTRRPWRVRVSSVPEEDPAGQDASGGAGAVAAAAVADVKPDWIGDGVAAGAVEERAPPTGVRGALAARRAVPEDAPCALAAAAGVGGAADAEYEDAADAAPWPSLTQLAADMQSVRADLDLGLTAGGGAGLAALVEQPQPQPQLQLAWHVQKQHGGEGQQPTPQASPRPPPQHGGSPCGWQLLLPPPPEQHSPEPLPEPLHEQPQHQAGALAGAALTPLSHAAAQLQALRKDLRRPQERERGQEDVLWQRQPSPAPRPWSPAHHAPHAGQVPAGDHPSSLPHKPPFPEPYGAAAHGAPAPGQAWYGQDPAVPAGQRAGAMAVPQRGRDSLGLDATMGLTQMMEDMAAARLELQLGQRERPPPEAPQPPAWTHRPSPAAPAPAAAPLAYSGAAPAPAATGLPPPHFTDSEAEAAAATAAALRAALASQHSDRASAQAAAEGFSFSQLVEGMREARQGLVPPRPEPAAWGEQQQQQHHHHHQLTRDPLPASSRTGGVAPLGGERRGTAAGAEVGGDAASLSSGSTCSTQEAPRGASTGVVVGNDGDSCDAAVHAAAQDDRPGHHYPDDDISFSQLVHLMQRQKLNREEAAAERPAPHPHPAARPEAAAEQEEQLGHGPGAPFVVPLPASSGAGGFEHADSAIGADAAGPAVADGSPHLWPTQRGTEQPEAATAAAASAAAESPTAPPAAFGSLAPCPYATPSGTRAATHVGPPGPPGGSGVAAADPGPAGASAGTCGSVLPDRTPGSMPRSGETLWDPMLSAPPGDVASAPQRTPEPQLQPMELASRFGPESPLGPAPGASGRPGTRTATPTPHLQREPAAQGGSGAPGQRSAAYATPTQLEFSFGTCGVVTGSWGEGTCSLAGGGGSACAGGGAKPAARKMDSRTPAVLSTQGKHKRREQRPTPLAMRGPPPPLPQSLVQPHTPGAAPASQAEAVQQATAGLQQLLLRAPQRSPLMHAAHPLHPPSRFAAEGEPVEGRARAEVTLHAGSAPPGSLPAPRQPCGLGLLLSSQYCVPPAHDGSEPMQYAAMLAEGAGLGLAWQGDEVLRTPGVALASSDSEGEELELHLNLSQPAASAGAVASGAAWQPSDAAALATDAARSRAAALAGPGNVQWGAAPKPEPSSPRPLGPQVTPPQALAHAGSACGSGSAAAASRPLSYAGPGGGSSEHAHPGAGGHQEPGASARTPQGLLPPRASTPPGTPGVSAQDVVAAAMQPLPESQSATQHAAPQAASSGTPQQQGTPAADDADAQQPVSLATTGTPSAQPPPPQYSTDGAHGRGSPANLLAGAVVVVDRCLERAVAAECAAAVEVLGGRLSGASDLGCGATAVVCEPSRAGHWLAWGAHLLSPRTVLRTAACARSAPAGGAATNHSQRPQPPDVLCVSKGVARVLQGLVADAACGSAPVNAGAGRQRAQPGPPAREAHAAGEQDGQAAGGTSARATGSNAAKWATRQGRRQFLLDVKAAEAAAGARLGGLCGGGDAHARVHAAAPLMLLEHVTWSLADRPETATCAGGTGHGGGWAEADALGASQGSQADDAWRPCAATQAEQPLNLDGVAFQGPRLTLLLLQDQHGHLGHHALTLVAPAPPHMPPAWCGGQGPGGGGGSSGGGGGTSAGFTVRQLLDAVHAHYAGALQDEEVAAAMATHADLRRVLQVAWQRQDAVARLALLGGRTALCGLRRCAPSASLAVYEVLLA